MMRFFFQIIFFCKGHWNWELLLGKQLNWANKKWDFLALNLAHVHGNFNKSTNLLERSTTIRVLSAKIYQLIVNLYCRVKKCIFAQEIIIFCVLSIYLFIWRIQFLNKTAQIKEEKKMYTHINKRNNSYVFIPNV
jgi:hypothetical protein